MKGIRSIRGKLLGVVLLSTFSALAVAGGFFLAYDVNSFRIIRVNDMSTQISLLAYASIPALQFNDTSVAQQNLDLMRLRPSVRSAAIYDAMGDLFASYSRNGARVDFPVSPAGEGVEIANDRITVVQPIVENGQFLGTAYMDTDYLLRNRINNFLRILGLVTAGAMAVAVAIALWLQSYITRPVRSIAAIAREATSRKDYSRRAEKLSEDEIGSLVDAFNDMLDEIESRTSALENTNRNLEQEIRERKVAREEVLRLNMELARKVQELKEADRRKDDFLATLAHELRNPLAPIRSGIDVLRRNQDGDRENIYGILERQTQQLIRLVDDLMDVSRITRGKISLQKERVRLAEVLQAAVEATRDLMREKEHSFTLDLSEEEFWLYADPVRLTQVFLNLLSNAAHYTRKGGCIKLSARRKEGTVEIRIQDTGIGMSRDMLDQVFEAFIQIENPFTRSKSGLGIGLTLVRSLVQMHGGKVHAESAGLEKGTTLVVELPLTEMQGEDHAPEATDFEEGDYRRRILVVDDNEDAARTLALLLGLKGYEVRVVFDGYSALSEGEKFRPDIVLMDLGMPGMNGVETGRAMRATPWGKELQMVAITGWGQDSHRRLTSEAGFDLHLVKPVTSEMIEALLTGELSSPGA